MLVSARWSELVFTLVLKGCCEMLSGPGYTNSHLVSWALPSNGAAAQWLSGLRGLPWWVGLGWLCVERLLLCLRSQFFGRWSGECFLHFLRRFSEIFITTVSISSHRQLIHRFQHQVWMAGQLHSRHFIVASTAWSIAKPICRPMLVVYWTWPESS